MSTNYISLIVHGKNSLIFMFRPNLVREEIYTQMGFFQTILADL